MRRLIIGLGVAAVALTFAGEAPAQPTQPGPVLQPNPALPPRAQPRKLRRPAKPTPPPTPKDRVNPAGPVAAPVPTPRPGPTLVAPEAQPTPAAAQPDRAVAPDRLRPPTKLQVRTPDNDSGKHIELSWDQSTHESTKENTVVYVVTRTRLVPFDDPPALYTDATVGEQLGDWTVVAEITPPKNRAARVTYTDDVTGPKASSAKAPSQTWKLGRAGVAQPPRYAADQSGDPVRVALKVGNDFNLYPVTSNAKPAGPDYSYAVRAVLKSKDGTYVATSSATLAGPVRPQTAYFNSDRWYLLFTIVFMAIALWFYSRRIKQDPEGIFVRRIAGVDAIEEAVGRSTEMGRPVLYVTGVEEIQNIQTIASLLVLGHVSEMTADYDTEIKVANFFPLTMVVAEEIVKQGYANAGRIDAHRPENVMFISAEQFAFAAGVNGLILRDKPATNIYLGRFFAESLILAETGYVTKAVQIAGTAEITQLPFFIAACDYTIIGEELYAVSAYLSREPGLLAMLKATDAYKVILMGLLLAGAVGATMYSWGLATPLASLSKVLFP